MPFDNYKNQDDIKIATQQIRGELFDAKDIELFNADFAADYEFTSDERVELHVYDNNGQYINSLDVRNWELVSSGSVPQLLFNPKDNLHELGITSGKFKLVYNVHQHIIHDLYIQQISPSRTEIRLRPASDVSVERRREGEEVVNELAVRWNRFIDKEPDIFDDVHLVLNFGANVILPVVKWDVDDTKFPEHPHSIVLKLYEPLPSGIAEKTKLFIHRQITRPIIESAILHPQVDDEIGNAIAAPNFGIEFDQQSTSQMEMQSWDDILSTYTSTTNLLIDKYLSSSVEGIDLNIDFRKYENFVNFSSAEERLKNFRYKLGLIESYNMFVNQYSGSANRVTGSASSSAAITAEALINRDKRRNLISGFDAYERYLYYESSSYESSSLGEFTPSTWPKSTNVRDYSNYSITASNATAWYASQVATASVYDSQNPNRLTNLIPLHIRMDDDSDSYETFVDMVGQHFDIFWTYIKALSDLSNRDSAVGDGIPADLLFHVAESMGFDTYGGKNAVGLWQWAFGTNVSGSYSQAGVTSSISDGMITKEIWSRILHNIPYLMKTKGTERGVKALLACYGIPSSLLRVREYGGPFATGSSNYANVIRESFRYGLKCNRSDYIIGDVPTGTKTIELRFRPYINIPIPASQSLCYFPTGALALEIFRSASSEYGRVAYYDTDTLLETPKLPIFNGDAWTVMIRSGSTNTELFVKNYKYGKIMHTASAAVAGAGLLVTSGSVWIGTDAGATAGISGTLQEFRCWDIVLNETAFDNHVANPSAYNGNDFESAYDNLTRRYSFNSASDYGSGVAVPDINPAQSVPISASTVNYSTSPGWSYESEEIMAEVPNLGATTYNSNKIRIESSSLRYGRLSHDKRAEVSSYDFAPLDSHKLGLYFSPVDPINDDIIDQFGASEFQAMIGDYQDIYNDRYSALATASVEYWKKYSNPNSFWDYLKFIKYYDMSLFRQMRKLLPIRANSAVGVLIEPNLLERPKRQWKSLTHEVRYYTSSIAVNDTNLSASAEYLTYTGSMLVLGDRHSVSGSYDTYTGSLDIGDVLKPATRKLVTESVNMTTTGIGVGAPIIFPYWKQGVLETFNTYTGSLTGSAGVGWCTQIETDTPDTKLRGWTVSEYYSRYYGCIQTEATTPDLKLPVETTLTNPNKLIATDTGISRIEIE